MSIFAFCVFLPREFERNRTLSKKTIYRLRKFLGWCIIKLKIRLRIFLYTPVLCLWSSDDRNYYEEFNKSKSRSAHAVFPSYSTFNSVADHTLPEIFSLLISAEKAAAPKHSAPQGS